MKHLLFITFLSVLALTEGQELDLESQLEHQEKGLADMSLQLHGLMSNISALAENFKQLRDKRQGVILSQNLYIHKLEQGQPEQIQTKKESKEDKNQENKVVEQSEGTKDTRLKQKKLSTKEIKALLLRLIQQKLHSKK